MRIIFLEAVQDYGGARKSTIELARRVRQKGHEVLIVDFWGSCFPFIREMEKFDLEYKILDRREDPFILSDRNKLIYLLNIVKYSFIQKQYRKKFAALANDFSADVVCVNNRKCLNILSKKAAYHIDYFARGWFAYRSLGWMDKRKFKSYRPRFITVSQATRQAIYSGGMAGLKDIYVCNSVIEKKIVEQYNPNYQKFSDEYPIKILHSGGFLYTKGQNVCIEIARELKEKNIPFNMILTGILYKGKVSEKYYESVVESIERYNLTSEIEIVLNKTDVDEYFRWMDILIHPSWTEGLPRVALEALSMGKPVIANPVGGVTDVVINGLTGYLADFNNVEQYVEYICQYYYDYDLYRKHSEMARCLILNNYTEANQFKTIDRIYPKVY